MRLLRNLVFVFLGIIFAMIALEAATAYPYYYHDNQPTYSPTYQWRHAYSAPIYVYRHYAPTVYYGPHYHFRAYMPSNYYYRYIPVQYYYGHYNYGHNYGYNYYYIRPAHYKYAW